MGCSFQHLVMVMMVMVLMVIMMLAVMAWKKLSLHGIAHQSKDNDSISL